MKLNQDQKIAIKGLIICFTLMAILLFLRIQFGIGARTMEDDVKMAEMGNRINNALNVVGLGR